MVQPTYLQVTPRFFSSVHSEYLQALDQACREEGSSVGEKLDSESVPAEIRERVVSKFKGYLGGRQQVIILAAAVTSPKLRNFVELCFDNAMVLDIYGTSEVSLCEWINCGVSGKEKERGRLIVRNLLTVGE